MINDADAARFWAKVRKTDGCWEWTGARQFKDRGYGCGYANGRVTGAHRVSWMLHFGDIPKGILVLHDCDNRICVRPEHLFLGTAKDNTADMMRKGRGHSPGARSPRRGAAHGGSKFTEAQVRAILAARGTISDREFATQFGVSRFAVSLIRRRRAWKHVVIPSV